MKKSKRLLNIQEKNLCLRRAILLFITFVPIITIVTGELIYQHIKPETWKTYTPENSDLLDPLVSAILFDQGDIWIGTGNGLNLIKPDGSWKSYTAQNSDLLDNEIRSLEMDKNHNLWIRSSNGISVLKSDKTWITYPASFFGTEDEREKYVLAFAIDPSNRVWVGTFQGIFILVNGQIEENYTIENSDLLNDGIWSFYVDNAETLWVGTREGVNTLDLDTNQWATYDKDQLNVMDAWVLFITGSKEGQIWVGTDAGGVTYLSADDTWHTYTQRNSGLIDDTVRAIAIDEQERVWLGGYGLSVIEVNGNWRTYTVARSGLPNNEIRALAIDEKNHLWIGTREGLSILNLQEELPESLSPSISALRTRVITPIEYQISLLSAMVLWGIEDASFTYISIIFTSALISAAVLIVVIWIQIFNGVVWKQVAKTFVLLLLDWVLIQGLFMLASMIAIVSDL